MEDCRLFVGDGEKYPGAKKNRRKNKKRKENTMMRKKEAYKTNEACTGVCDVVNRGECKSKVRSLNPFFPLLFTCPYTAQPDRHEARQQLKYVCTTDILSLSPRPWEALPAPQSQKVWLQILREPFQLYKVAMATLDDLLPSIPSL